MELTGGCLCGAVRYRTGGPAMMAGHCHCADCRRSSGTSACTHAVFAEEGFALSGTLSVYERAADSGNIVARAFCPVCGSPVLSRNAAIPGLVFVRASSLDDMEAVSPSMTVYAGRAPSWAPIDRANPVFDGAPALMAEMAGNGPAG